MNKNKPELLYHICPDNKAIVKDILRDGLRCNSEGQIFLFENKSIGLTGSKVIKTVADCVASTQVGISRYTMLEINTDGVLSELIPDQVGELTAKFQWYIMQKRIKPEYISVFTTADTDFTSIYG